MESVRQIVLDTETTGLEPSEGHRVIEIGCVELINRKLTGNHFHYYMNPEREVEEEALRVHGISNEFLLDKPKFAEIADEFIQYIDGAELVIHNAAFDVGFLNHELSKLSNRYGNIENHCQILDTLQLARTKHPRQRVSLDALCKRYQIDNSERTLHGALLDSEILAEVYLAMTGGQLSMSWESEEVQANSKQKVGGAVSIQRASHQLTVIRASEEELTHHQKQVEKLVETLGENWW